MFTFIILLLLSRNLPRGIIYIGNNTDLISVFLDGFCLRM